MKNYKEVGMALDLFLEGEAISYDQLKVIQSISEIEEIKDMILSLNKFPGMIESRASGWKWSEIGIYGAVDDKKILNPLENPPKEEGVKNFLKKHDLSQYLYSEPRQVGNGMAVDLCVGGSMDAEEKVDDIHYHIHLELLGRNLIHIPRKLEKKEQNHLSVLPICILLSER